MEQGILGWLEHHARQTPDQVALIGRAPAGEVGATTYQQLLRQVRQWAAFVGARLEDPSPAVVPVFAQRSPSMVAGILAVMAAGHCATPLTNKLRPAQVAGVLEQSRARLGLLDGAALLALRGAREGDLPTRCRWWWHDHAFAQPMHRKQFDRLASWLPVAAWPQDGAPEPAAARAVDLTAPAICIFTSGSTGVPKGVLISGADLLARAEAEVELFGLSGRDVLLNVLPFSFDVGLNQLLSGIVAGATLVILDSWLPADISGAVARHGVTGISGVPAIWQDFLNQRQRFEQPSTLRYVTISGGALAHEFVQELPALSADLQVYKTYGQTEAFRPTALRPEHLLAKPGSVGQPFASSRVYVVNAQGQPAAPLEEGEVVHAGLGTMLGYLGGVDDEQKRRPNPFKRAPHDPEVAIYTGDYGYFDHDGFLFLRGRRDHMVKINGHRVYPDEVVPALLELDEVAEAAVVAVPEDQDYTLVAFLVGQEAQIDDRRLMKHLGERIAPYMVPRRYVWQAGLPRTPSGKPDLARLQDLAERLIAGP